VRRAVCSYCGIPFRVFGDGARDGADYCCSGCAMAARLNVSAEKFPVTPQLVYLLILAFGVFNQALLIVLALALVNEGRAQTAERFAAASAIVAIVLFAAALVWQWRARLVRATDIIVFALAAGLAVTDAFLLFDARFGAASLAGLVATGSAALWQSRGFARRWLGRARRKNA